MASESYSDSEIASTPRVNVSTVERTREKFVVGGLEYAIQDRPHPPKPRETDWRSLNFGVRDCHLGETALGKNEQV
jgi:hypothetical protein